MAREIVQLIDVINDSINKSLANLHTATIAKITKVDDKTINCKPVINREVDGESIELPEFIEVPPVFMQGGGSYTAHPVKAGDYCLLIITERCFDQWYSGRDNVSPPEFRLFDYSDSFAIVGVNPLQAAISIPEVITQIGDTYQEGNYEHKGDNEQTGKFTLVGDMQQTGNMDVDGNIKSTGNIEATGNVEAATYSVGGAAGKTGAFVDLGGNPMIFTNGLLTGP